MRYAESYNTSRAELKYGHLVYERRIKDYNKSNIMSCNNMARLNTTPDVKQAKLFASVYVTILAGYHSIGGLT